MKKYILTYRTEFKASFIASSDHGVGFERDNSIPSRLQRPYRVPLGEAVYIFNNVVKYMRTSSRIRTENGSSKLFGLHYLYFQLKLFIIISSEIKKMYFLLTHPLVCQIQRWPFVRTYDQLVLLLKHALNLPVSTLWVPH